MSKLMRNRWLRWSLLLGLLTALGVGIYEVEPPEAKFEIEAPGVRNLWLSADGQRLIAASRSLTLWDTTTGAEIAHFLDADKDILGRDNFSEGCRHYAVNFIRDGVAHNANRPAVLIVDFVTGKATEVPLDRWDENAVLFFSPSGNLLVRFSEKSQRLEIYDATDGRLLTEQAATYISDAPFVGEDISYVVETQTDENKMVVWNTRDREPIAALDDAFGILRRSPTGPFWTVHRKSAGKAHCLLWNAETRHIAVDLPFGDGPNLYGHSPDGRWLAFFEEKEERHEFEIRDSVNGRTAAAFSARHGDVAFSPDSKFVLFLDRGGKGEQSALQMFDLATLQPCWELGSSLAAISIPSFSQDSQTFFIDAVAQQRPVVCAYDCATGKTRLWFPVLLPPDWRVTRDRSSLLILERETPPLDWPWLQALPWIGDWLSENRKGATTVFDADTCEERFRLRGWNVERALLSDDGQTLATSHAESDGRCVLRCWDVDARKPLRWPIGVPAGLATLAVLFTLWRWRRRANPVNVGGATCPS